MLTPPGTWFSRDARAVTRLFGPALKRAQYLINWSREHRYIYIEVPKTGCSTIKLTLQRIERNDPAYAPPNMHSRPASPLLRPLSAPKEFLLARTSPDYFRFCFVRNPYTRILSAYLDKIASTDFKRGERMKALGISPSESPTLLQFLEVLKRTDPAAFDIHWARQCDLLDLGGMTFEFTGRFESFEQDFARVLERIHQGQEWLTAVRAHRTDAAALIQDRIGPDERRLIADIYANDFDRFGYSRDLAAA